MQAAAEAVDTIGKYAMYVLIGVLMIATGCREQELPVEVVGEPVFWIEGDLDGAGLALTAGENDYYMETGYERDDEDVLVLFGAFSPLNCEPCPEALEVRIRDHRLRGLNDPVAIDSLVQIGEYDFYRAENRDGSAVFRVSFTNESSDEGNNSYSWDFGDGTTSTEANPVHDYEDTSMSTVLVCLEGSDPSGCTTQLCNEIQLQEVPCKADFKHELFPSSTYVEFQNQVTGVEPIQYRWDFGDGYGASLGNPGYFYEQADLYTVCLEIIDGNGCKSEICKNIAADPDLCEHNFTYKVQSTTLPDSLQFSRVEVRWTDENGQFFSSANQDQGESNYFEILGVESYEPNRFGEPTLRLRVAFDCLIGDGSGQKSLKKVEGFLAIAYPA